MALHLGQYLAIYLAGTITGLLQKVLTHPAKGLVDETNRAVREKEQQRPPNGLVKVVCLPFDGAATDARFETMIGPIVVG